MRRAVLPILVCLAVGVVVLRQTRADGRGGDAYDDVAAIETWAKQSYSGGANVEKFSKEGRELVVVSGMPTSGLLTTQLVVLGRADAKSAYRMVLRSAVFMGAVKVRQQKDDVTGELDGKQVLDVPFALASVVVHTSL